MAVMQIGEVARRAGVGVDTVRFYEREGLIEEPARRPSGYRQYPAETIPLIRFIKRAQDLGFTLREVEELVSLRDGDGTRKREVRARAEAKLKDIDQKLARLQAMRSALWGLLEACACGKKPSCPILEALNEPVAEPLQEKRSNGRR